MRVTELVVALDEARVDRSRTFIEGVDERPPARAVYYLWRDGAVRWEVARRTEEGMESLFIGTEDEGCRLLQLTLGGS